MIVDRFSQYPLSLLTAPLTHLEAVTPSDDAVNSPSHTYVTRALLVGSAGSLTVRMEDGNDVVIPHLETGIFHPIRVKHVYATGTSASFIVGGD